MNCLLETTALLFLSIRDRCITPGVDNLQCAEENLETCRSGLQSKEKELYNQCYALGREAANKRSAGDVEGAKYKLQVYNMFYCVMFGVCMLPLRLSDQNPIDRCTGAQTCKSTVGQSAKWTSST